MRFPRLDYARMNPKIIYVFVLCFGACFGFSVAAWQNGVGWAIITVGIAGFLWVHASYVFLKATNSRDPVIKKEKSE